MIVVSDSSPIIALARASKLHLLRDLFSEVLIPNGVYNELAQEGRAGAEEVKRGLFIKRERVTIKDTDLSLTERFGQADAEVIILAKKKRPDVFILTDDRPLIRQAEEEDISFMTTRGILLEAKSQGFITNVKEIMDEMRRQGVGVENEDYEDTLRQAGEK